MKKSKFQIFVLFIILIGFPALSWYYLKSGFDYQMTARAELKDYGNLTTFSFTDMEGKELNQDSLKSKMVVLAFLGKNDEINNDMLEIIGRLNQQFGDNESLRLLVGTLQPERDSLAKLKQVFTSGNYIADQVVLYRGDKDKIQRWLGKEIKIPVEWIENEDGVHDIRIVENDNPELEDYPFFVVTDTKHKIRNFYHIQKQPEIHRMVEHIALLLPREPEIDAVYVPEKEK
ncbi:MAG: SCO family protein [Bacteroidota bacterium]